MVSQLKLVEAVRVALQALVSNKLRSILTMLGVIIGVGAVIILVSMGNGATTEVTAEVEGLGSNLIVLTPRPPARFTSADAELLGERVPTIVSIMPSVSGSATVRWGTDNIDLRIEGVDASYPSVRSHGVSWGRFLTETDLQRYSRVAVVGWDLVEKLFSGVDPVGQVIKIAGQPFTVVGVMGEKGSGGIFQSNDDEKVLVPLTTGQRLLGTRWVSALYVKAETGSEPLAVAHLRRIFEVQYGDEEAVSILSQEQILEVLGQVTGILTAMLGGIGGISLIVGGIGIMNIMLVSVTERTREIGIRKAIGAKRRDIMLQFLVESVAISVLGGLIGMALGYFGSQAISRLTAVPTVISAPWVGIAIGFSALIGIFFGLYPAYKASRLDPIEALRHD